MQNPIAILTENFGVETVLVAVVVCALMALIKKFKPDLSPKAEVGVRFLISLIIRLILIWITRGDATGCIESATSVCGVSMIVCALITKNGSKEKVKEQVSTLLPNLDESKLDAVLSVEQTESVLPLVADEQTKLNGERAVE